MRKTLEERLQEQRQHLPPIIRFRYQPAKHTYLASLGSKINGNIIPFDSQTDLVSRGQILFGLIDHDGVIQPIFNRDGLLVTYNFDQNKTTRASHRKNKLYGVGYVLKYVASNNSHKVCSGDLSGSDSS